MGRIVNVFILFLVGIYNLNFAQDLSMEKYQYDSGIGTPSNYDIDTYQQVFYSKNKEIIPIYGMGVHLGGMWGSGNSFVVQEGLNPVPNILKIGYYSYVENKFFEGEFNLPYNEIEKYLQEKITNPLTGVSQSKYNYFSIGISLKGLIVLWINGKEDQKDIGRFQAVEKHYAKFSDVFDDERSQNEIYEGWFKNFDDNLKSKILSNSLPFGIWDLYRKKYKLKYSCSKQITWMQMQMINMEKETVYALDNTSYIERAIPYNIWLKWEEGGKSYEARIVLAKDEKYYKTIYKAENGSRFPEDYRDEETYKTFNLMDQNIPAELLIKINAENTDIKLLLKQGDKEYLINNIIFKIFSK